jgi:hypothetical protein
MTRSLVQVAYSNGVLQPTLRDQSVTLHSAANRRSGRESNQ